MVAAKSDKLPDSEWERLLRRIKRGECTPFIGAGACAGTIPVGASLAREWADKHDYPLVKDRDDLARVAQFLAVDQDPIFPKELIRDEIEDVVPPDFGQQGEPHGVLADLKLPLYITTNYDGFMWEALHSRQTEPRREICAWNDFLKDQPSVFNTDFEPSAANPVVYHLHGYYELPQSLVLTEDDYLTFLVRISRDNAVPLLPAVVRTAMASNSLLFVGYSLADWDFRVLFRALIGSLGGTIGTTNIAVQLEPEGIGDSADARTRALDYLRKYFEKIQMVKVQVYWGDAKEFGCELSERWGEFQKSGDESS
jgi:SIR2-like domain